MEQMSPHARRRMEARTKVSWQIAQTLFTDARSQATEQLLSDKPKCFCI